MSVVAARLLFSCSSRQSEFHKKEGFSGSVGSFVSLATPVVGSDRLAHGLCTVGGGESITVPPSLSLYISMETGRHRHSSYILYFSRDDGDD